MNPVLISTLGLSEVCFFVKIDTLVINLDGTAKQLVRGEPCIT